jgi:hypothetical protein
VGVAAAGQQWCADPRHRGEVWESQQQVSSGVRILGAGGTCQVVGGGGGRRRLLRSVLLTNPAD